MAKEPTHTYIKVSIGETSRTSPNAEPAYIGRIEEAFKTIDEVKEFLIERYNRIPKGRKKIYIDTKNGAEEIGFLHSFWTREPGEASIYRTDWIEISDVQETTRRL